MKISKCVLDRIKEHGKRTYPEECCGVLLGKVDGDEKVFRDLLEIENKQEDQRQRRFLITPEAYQEADKQARKVGLETLGFYHSHPDHPAQPSQYDLEHAWAWFSYVITRVENGQPRESTSWVLRDDRSAFEEEVMEEID